MSLKRHKVGVWLSDNYKDILLLLGLSFLLYIPFVASPFISDDLPSIVNHPLIGTWGNILARPHSFIQPLLYNIIFKIGGATPFLFRIPNIFVHMGNVILIYAIFTLLKNRVVALYTALLFAVHPILTESVTWISGGNYGKGAFFFLLSFLFYLFAKKDKKLYTVSVVSYLFALFSLDKVIVLPAVFLLYEFLFHNKKERYVRVIPFFILGLVYVGIYSLQLFDRLSFLHSIQYAQQKSIYSYNQLWQIPIAISMYLQLIVLPIHLTVYHTELVSYPELAVRTTVFILFTGFTLFWVRKNKLIFFWLSFFFISLIPTLLPLGLGSSVAERYVYLGSVGIFFLIANLFYWLQKKYSPQVVVSIFAIIIAILSVRTLVRNYDYTSFDNFWISTVNVSPLSYQAHNNVGIIYIRRGEYQKALDELQKAIQIVPNTPQPYQNIGSIFFSTGQYDQALKFYEKALSLDPNLWASSENIAAIYFSKEDYKKAEEYTKNALKVVPTNIEVLGNLGLIYYKQGKTKEAKDVFNKILEIDPTNQGALSALSELK